MDPGYHQNGIRSATPSTAESFPGFDVEVTVPSDVKCRIVYGSFQVTPTVTNRADVRAAHEETPAGGFTEVQELGRPASGGDIVVPFSFPVPGGCKYKFTKGGLAGVTEQVPKYNFNDLR